jgi:drug/metabolite transporter (DMT)-like permease
MILGFVTIGVLVASYGELRFSAMGCFYQVLGVTFEATRLVLTNMSIREFGLDPLSTLYYIAPLASMCILISFLIFEASSFPLWKLGSIEFALLLLLNGCIAFTLNIASVLVMTKASALILVLSGIVKDVLLVVFSMTFFASPVTPVQFFGFGIALLGLQAHKEYKKDPAVFKRLNRGSPSEPASNNASTGAENA